MGEFYVTRRLKETLECRLLLYIYKLIEGLAEKVEEVDYLQVFDIEGNKLIHHQEVPEYRKEHRLGFYAGNMKLFAVRQENGENCHWVVMYSDEY